MILLPWPYSFGGVVLGIVGFISQVASAPVLVGSDGVGYSMFFRRLDASLPSHDRQAAVRGLPTQRLDGDVRNLLAVLADSTADPQLRRCFQETAKRKDDA